MTTLTSPAISSLLEQLYARADAATSPVLAQVTPAEQDRLLRSKTEYLQVYSAIKELWLPVSRETGKLLYALARSARARNIIEFGTSFGISTIHMAAALRDNGGGRLITTEFEADKLAGAARHFADAGLSDLIELRAGDALDTLSRDLPQQIDLVLLDGAKALYNDVLTLLEPQLRPGALILADNVNYCPEYVERVRSASSGYLSVPFADDIELSCRLAQG